MINIKNKETFITSNDIDYINCANIKFFKEIWKNVNVVDGVADTQTLFDLKMYAAVQHYQNFKFKKAAQAEYDLKFLFKNFGCMPKIVKKYITDAELNSIIYK